MANTVKRSDIKNNSINASKIASGSVTANKLAANSITSDKLSSGCINISHLSESAINSFAGLVTGNAGPAGPAGTNGTNGTNGVSPIIQSVVTYPVTIGTGNKVFTISSSSNIGFSEGQRIKLWNSTNIWMEGEIYSITSNVIGFNSDISKGAGTYNSWKVFITGQLGTNGTNGTNGLQGIQGVKGDTGPQGSQGPQGPAGAIGPAGATGAIGPAGPAGTNGTNGTNGLQGIQGVKGDTGLQGIQGVKGDTGIQGVKGDTGTNGPNSLSSSTTSTLGEGMVYSNSSGSAITALKRVYGYVGNEPSDSVATRTTLNGYTFVEFGNTTLTASKSILLNTSNPQKARIQNDSGVNRDFLVSFSTNYINPANSSTFRFALKLGSEATVKTDSIVKGIGSSNALATNSVDLSCIVSIPSGDYITILLSSGDTTSTSTAILSSYGFRFSIVAL